LGSGSGFGNGFVSGGFTSGAGSTGLGGGGGAALTTGAGAGGRLLHKSTIIPSGGSVFQLRPKIRKPKKMM
jgi:hypothetical protein